MDIDEDREALAEGATKIVENLALRVAERTGGRVTPNALAPYLPMSLAMINSCLADMADGSSVVCRFEGNCPVYQFAEQEEATVKKGLLALDQCLACEADIEADPGEILCAGCREEFMADLGRFADLTGWPGQAVYEHEILYIAANTPAPLYLETLADRSRYPVRRMAPKLDRLAAEGFVRQKKAETRRGGVEHVFPPLLYPKTRYRANMGIIRRFPASGTEELEMKVFGVLTALAVMLAIGFVLAFCLVPLSLLAVCFAVLAPLVSLFIWRRRLGPVSD